MLEPDPYRNFKFRLFLDERCVAAFSAVDAPPEQQLLTLERGVTFDHEFEGWVRESVRNGVTFGVRDFSLVVYSENGERLTSYRVHRSYAAAWLALPYMDSDKIAVRALKLICDGWDQESAERDGSDRPREDHE